MFERIGRIVLVFIMLSSVSHCFRLFPSMGGRLGLLSNATRRHMSHHAVVKQLTPQEFSIILKSVDREKYQIIDVREKNELGMAKLADKKVINLPLGSASEWTTKVENGELLNKTAPTIVLCHHGMRSMRVASFLGMLYVRFRLLC
jgi:rhodanese-related sulfurtransferase